MKNFDNERVNELVIDEWIWVAFIILSSLNIGGDELEKHYCYYHEQRDMDISKKIFTITVFASFLIYIYIAYRNCHKYKNLKLANQDISIMKIRCLASILVVIAAFLFLFAQLSDQTPANPSIE